MAALLWQYTLYLGTTGTALQLCMEALTPADVVPAST